MNITIYPKITHTEGGHDKPLLDILGYIKTGRWKDKITQLRFEKAQAGKSARYKALKKDLPYFTTSGTFNKRCDEGLKEHSGFVAIDIDNIQNLPITRKKIEADPYTFAVFISCSGNGLCAIIKINPESHYESFENLSIYYTQTLNIEIDHLADVSRPRFISFDPDLYLNTDSKLFDLEYEKQEETIYEVFSTNQDTEANLTKAVEMVEKNLTYQEGSKHNYMVDLAKVCNKFGVDLSYLQGFIRASYPDWYTNPTNAIEHVYRTRKAAHGAFQQTNYTSKTQTSYKVQEKPLSEDEFITKLKGLEADWHKPVDRPTPIVSCKGSMISTAGNITLYSGHSKVGKSGVITAIKAGSMASQFLNIDTLGFEVEPNVEEKLFLSIDTEQSRYNFDKNFRDSIKRAEKSDCPDWFKSLWFKNESTKHLIDYTWKALEYYSDQFGGVYHIVIDGIGDYVLSANDDAESRDIVTQFTQMAEKYNCPLSTMLHLNPGSDKQRGHLGTFLQHKSESVLKITREKDISTLEFQLLRNGGDAPNINFRYSKEKGYHVFLGYADNFHGDVEGELKTMFEGVLSITDLSLKELEIAIAEAELISPAKARNYIREARSKNIIKQIRPGFYSLDDKDYVPF